MSHLKELKDSEHFFYNIYKNITSFYNLLPLFIIGLL